MLVPRQRFDSKPQPTRGHPARHHALHPSPLETMEHAALHIHIDAHKTTHTHTHTQTRVQIVRETASGEWTNSSKVRLARGVAPRHERFSALIHSCLPAFLPSAQTRQAADQTGCNPCKRNHDKCCPPAPLFLLGARRACPGIHPCSRPWADTTTFIPQLHRSPASPAASTLALLGQLP